MGSLGRSAHRDVTYLRILPATVTPDEVQRAKRDLRLVAADEVRQACQVEVVQSDDALQTMIEYAEQSDLLILGVQRVERRRKVFGRFTREIAQRSTVPLIVISRRG